MREETAPVAGEEAGGTSAGTGLCLDTITSAEMHLFSAMFLLVMLAALPCQVRTPALTRTKHFGVKVPKTAHVACLRTVKCAQLLCSHTKVKTSFT